MAIEMMNTSTCYCSEYMTKTTQFGDEPKLFSLLAFIGIAATASAQVTFSYDSGDNNDDWDAGTSSQNVTVDGQIWRANPGEGSYVILKTSDNSQTHIQGYTITLAGNSQTDGRLPYAWKLEGSNDKETWTLIHRQMQANRMVEDFDDSNTSTNGKSYTYYCNTKNNAPYKYFKLTVTGKARGSWGCFEMAKFDLIPSNVGFSASGLGMDGDTNTKQDGNSFPQTITVTGTASTRITGFQFTTGGDNASYHGRNPRTIKVEGSTDNTNWTTLLSLENYTGMEDKNYYPYVFDIDGSQNYLYYKFTFNDVSARFFQMSEIAIITPLEPLQISTPADLTNFSSLVNSGSTNVDAVLTADIDMSGVTGWTPIGRTDDGGDGNNGDKAYKGTFDGQGHTIDNLVQSVTTFNNQGLFGVVNGGCTIKNLILGPGCHFYGGKYVGAFVGSSRGSGWVTIENCGNEASVGSEYDKIDLHGAAFIGVVVNNGPATRITNCYNTGTVIGDGDSNSTILSGWFGGHGSVEVNNFYNIGSVQGTDGDNLFYRNGAGITFNNVYDITGKQDAAQITEAQVKSGELCVALGSAFTQDLSQEGHPTFGSKAVTGDKWFNTSENDVYYNYEGGSYQVYQLNLDETKLMYLVPGHVTAKNVSVARNIPANQWIGLCLPFDYDIPEGWDVRELTGVSGSGENASMKFSTASTIEAGKPYIVKPESSVTTITATGKAIATESTDVTFGGVTMVGNLNQTTIPQGSFYINKSSELMKLTATSATLNGFRAYFTVNGGSGVKALSFDFDDDATGINEELRIKNEESTSIFNLAGQRLSKTQKGINIVNGKKILK